MILSIISWCFLLVILATFLSIISLFRVEIFPVLMKDCLGVLPSFKSVGRICMSLLFLLFVEIAQQI